MQVGLWTDSYSAEKTSLERFGTKLVAMIASRFGPLPPEGWHPGRRVRGQEFEYHRSPGLFAGRSGLGPPRIVLDTNVHIDYFEHGHAMWSGDDLTFGVEGERGDQLEAIQLLLAVWSLRDVEFVMMKDSERDSKRKSLPMERLRRNHNA